MTPLHYSSIFISCLNKPDPLNILMEEGKKTASEALVFRVGGVGHVGEPSLPLADVPVQTLSQTLKPVVHQVVATDGRNGVTRRGDLNTVEGNKDD